MNIAVNTRLLLKDRLEGLGNFTHEVFQRIVRNHPEHQFFFIFDRPYDASFIYEKNVYPIVIGPQARHPFLFYLWFEWSVAKVLKKIRADIFVSPDGYLSLRSDVPQIPVIHDLNFHYYPEYFSFLVRNHYLYYFPKYAKKAKRIATVSEFSKNDIVNQYGISADKIDVIYNGVNQQIIKLTNKEKQTIQNQITGGRPYFVFIGGLYPRKNLINQLKAFDEFKLKTKSDVCFVIIGSRYKESEPVFQTINQMQFKDDVIIKGRVEPREIADRIIASSLALCYVSNFEGFGLPLVEAMRCNVPIITGNITAMPEIAEDSALKVSPHSISEIAHAMERIVYDEDLSQKLIEKGELRLRDFTWDKTADLLWNSIISVIEEEKNN